MKKSGKKKNVRKAVFVLFNKDKYEIHINRYYSDNFNSFNPIKNDPDGT